MWPWQVVEPEKQQIIEGIRQHGGDGDAG